MAECPNCGSRLDVQKPLFPLSLLMKKKFICPVCDWEMTIAEVNERGGLHRIKYLLVHGGRQQPQSDSPKQNNPRPEGGRRHHGNHSGRRHHNRHHRKR